MHVLHEVFLDLSISYLKMELSKARFYHPFSLLCISQTFLNVENYGHLVSYLFAYIGALSRLFPIIWVLHEMIVLCYEYAK